MQKCLILFQTLLKSVGRLESQPIEKKKKKKKKKLRKDKFTK